MPYNRPGNIFYTTNASGGNIPHGSAVLSEGRVGVAIKQKGNLWSAGATAVNTPLNIANGEDFAMVVKGIVQVATVAGFAVGDPIYLVPPAGGTGTPGALTETATGNKKFGMVTEIAGERGTPASQVRIDLDAKDQF